MGQAKYKLSIVAESFKLVPKAIDCSVDRIVDWIIS